MYCENCQDETTITNKDGEDFCCKCRKPFKSKHLERIREEEWMEERKKDTSKLETEYDLFKR
jgi:hypothetical protein